ncbi:MULTISPECIES: FAD-dependent oxidoreductase [Streptomyces]|uniref:Flavin-dependent monooxygenase n=1 Tax=Streptomyces gougerotii TaxID=53448 RepID=A0A8H9HJZ6_9ACTN|nr:MULTISPECIES: NAD(P)/FAD-dependent oxidoreductase [Streptomyces]MDQ0296420.1 2-polyprenyl-6-methoxyphenol hydroxylase-like FAD-dependent oxidoreductase [Streptomyces sp. DSM 41037]GFH68224.1 oxidoreductase [Streptomyces rutgersensis]GFH78855.1 oxidoreductase [Streptomyces gougerotii]GGU68610.1 oxidoreductase [Streptomyces gougerotii]
MTTAPIPEHHPLLVVGAGLGGLTLARVLALHGVGCTVLDRDADRDARSQGGMLDLHEDTAQAALREAGLYEGFRRLVQPGGEATRVLDRHATVHHADDAEGGRPEVHRAALRDLLLDALPAGTVRWGAQVTAATPLGGGRHEVRLADGTTLTTDLLVGADGAWSRVRPLVSDAAPAYTGVSFVEADLTDADRRHPRAAALVGSGLLFALDQGKGLLAHREPGARLHTYVALRCPAELLDSLGLADRAAARRRVLAHFDGWDEGLRSLLADGDGPLVARPVHALPVGHRWERAPGVSLLGDAAHLMTPFAGEGANLAMLDGAELAAALLARPQDPERALATYEAALFPRGERAARESAESLELCFGPDAARRLAAMMSGGWQDGAA